MMKMSTTPEFYIVISPKYHTLSSVYKDSDSKIYEGSCEYDAPGFKYITPEFDKITLFNIGRPFINTGVDYGLLSKVKSLGNDSEG